MKNAMLCTLCRSGEEAAGAAPEHGGTWNRQGENKLYQRAQDVLEATIISLLGGEFEKTEKENGILRDMRARRYL